MPRQQQIIQPINKSFKEIVDAVSKFSRKTKHSVDNKMERNNIKINKKKIIKK